MRNKNLLRLLVAACLLVYPILALAQDAQGGGGTAAGGGTSTGGTAGGGVGAGAGTSPIGIGGGNASPRIGMGSPNGSLNDQSPFERRPIFLSGTVMLSDGSVPAERVRIERVCNGAVRTEGHTDNRGRFSIQLGGTNEFQDASMSSSSGPAGAFGSSPQNGVGGFGSQTGMSEQELWGCDIQAALAGYRSDVISLAGRRAMDNPNLGTIVLRRYAGKVDGLMVSATAALAPKDAKKAYQKGLDAVKKRNADEAPAQLQKAVEIYPKYAMAWLALGRLQEQRSHPAEAQKAYEQAVAADSKFIPPYEHLAAFAMKSAQWQKVADVSGQILKLDPFTSINAYYMSSLANFQLGHFDIAEQHAQEAIKLDPLKKNVRSYYILGLAQASQSKFDVSAAALKVVIGAAPAGLDLDAVRKQLAQVEGSARAAATRPPQ